MISAVIDFADVLLAALVVGAMFGMWLILNPARRVSVPTSPCTSKVFGRSTRRCPHSERPPSSCR